MNYPVVIHKDKKSDYGASVPDLPGCISAGRTLDEALAGVREAIELHVEGLIDEGQPVPRAGTIEQHQRHPDYQHGTWAVVSVDPSKLRQNTIRINITVPERVLDAVDRHARANGKTRSGLLVEAVSQFIGRDEEPLPSRRTPAKKSSRKGK